MHLAAIDIENYKQYAGEHRIEFPEQGIVAVTGPNGAGKTTLFEAIEWCLYCPRSIPQSSVPPHDGVGRTTVRVTLEDRNGGQRYCVQRELRASGTQAEVYREDDPGNPLVQGTREVSRYVARHLIGLPHGAFVSTFFTKQKELQFFGDRSATERRIEVGKLLGLEAVREAQREMGEGRNVARLVAETRRGEYERRLGARDLAAETAAAARGVEEAEAREADAEAAARMAATEAEQARDVLDGLRDLQAQDAAFGQQLAELSGNVATANARRDGAQAHLDRLESRAAERMQLAGLAADLDRWQGEAGRLEAERERARQVQALQEAQGVAAAAECGVAARLEQLVSEHQAAARGLAGWVWSPADAADPGEAALRLHAVAAALDPATKRGQLERMQEAWRQAKAVTEIETLLGKYERQREKLVTQRERLLAAGDPTVAFEAAAQATRAARDIEQKARVSMAAARVEREEDERLAAGVRQHMEEPICPTCTRPLGPKEAARLAALLDEKVRVLAEDERRHLETAQAAAREIAAAESAEGEARARLEQVRSLGERLAEGQRLIDDAEAQRAEAVEALQAALGVIGASEAPSLEAIEEARLVADRTQRVAGLAGLIERLGDDATSARQAQDEAEARIEALGAVAFDEAALREAVEGLNRARRAAAQIDLIDAELANRQRYEEERAAEERELARLAARQAEIAAGRAALGFDPASLGVAQQREQAARTTANEARELHAAARHAVRDARAERDRVAADHDQLRELIEEADRHAREADDLTRMYDEFGEFDRYVARHVGPLLAETTERMLSQVTNGKYDHVRFDENYGIEVFDGDEAFPIANFSGGERDVVALCARLALSEVVGSAALRPPRFLVLDEVFGSLDSERRAQLLETLGALAHGGHFGQMFIISHVDDVQQSPVMTEAWTIEEREGVSRVVRQGHAELVAALGCVDGALY
jgi:exonuclease SbcC